MMTATRKIRWERRTFVMHGDNLPNVFLILGINTSNGSNGSNDGNCRGFQVSRVEDSERNVEKDTFES